MSAGDLPERLRRLAQRTDALPSGAPQEGAVDAQGPGATLTPQSMRALGAIAGQGLVESAEPTPTPPRGSADHTGFADAVWAQESRPEPAMTGAGRDIDMAMSGLLPQHQAPPAAFGAAPPDAFGAAPPAAFGAAPPPAVGPALGFGGNAAIEPRTAGLGPTYASLPRERAEADLPSPVTTGSWLTRGSNMVAVAVILGGLVYFIYKYARNVFKEALSVSVANPGAGAAAESKVDFGYESDASNAEPASAGDPELGEIPRGDDGEGEPKKNAPAQQPADVAKKSSRRQRGRKQPTKPAATAAASAVHVDPQFRPLDGTEKAPSAPEA